MGWFDKKETEMEKLPSLPELPRLPELPKFESINEIDHIHQLPSFPANSLGEKFSQNTIKEAVTGRKEEDEDDADEFAEDRKIDMQTMQKPLTRNEPATEFIRQKSYEPIFIRIDKFEESIQTLEKIKKQVLDIEKLLADTKMIKEKEEKELEMWEKEMKAMKLQIEKIDKNLFSKIY